MRIRLAASALAGSVLVGPAAAVHSDDCAVIFKAFEAMTQVPAYASVVQLATGITLRSVVIGEVVYAHSGEKWVKITMQPGGRLDMLKAFAPSPDSLSDCARVGTETVDGRVMTIYTYVPPAPQGLEKIHEAGGPQKLWIGADGLPYRTTTDTIDMGISYAGITPPIP